jgi:hypothetical protein
MRVVVQTIPARTADRDVVSASAELPREMTKRHGHAVDFGRERFGHYG